MNFSTSVISVPYYAASGLVITISLVVTAAHADWRDDLQEANAAMAAGKKSEAAELYLKVAREPSADVGERWAAIVNGVPMEPGRDKDLWILKGEIASTIAKQSDAGNSYWQAAGAYQMAGRTAEMLKSFRKALDARQSPLDMGAGVFVAALALSRDLEDKHDLAGAASLMVSQMDRCGDHLQHGLDRLNELTVRINKKLLSDKKEPVAPDQQLPLVEALKTAEETGKGLPEALTALGIKLPTGFSKKQTDVLTARDKAIADKNLPSANLPWQVAWYGGKQSADDLRAAVK